MSQAPVPKVAGLATTNLIVRQPTITTRHILFFYAHQMHDKELKALELNTGTCSSRRRYGEIPLVLLIGLIEKFDCEILQKSRLSDMRVTI